MVTHHYAQAKILRLEKPCYVGKGSVIQNSIFSNKEVGTICI